MGEAKADDFVKSKTDSLIVKNLCAFARKKGLLNLNNLTRPSELPPVILRPELLRLPLYPIGINGIRPPLHRVFANMVRIILVFTRPNVWANFIQALYRAFKNLMTPPSLSSDTAEPRA